MDGIYKYNSAAVYTSNKGQFLQILSSKDLYTQTIIIRDDFKKN